MDTEKRRAEYDDLEHEEAQRVGKPEKTEKTRTEHEELELEHKQLRTRVKELEDEKPKKGTIMWDDKGEQVSTFQIENDRMWMIIENVGKYSVMNCFQTERVFFVKLIDVIRRDKLKEAVILITEDKKFLLKHVSWEEIAKRAIRERL